MQVNLRNLFFALLALAIAVTSVVAQEQEKEPQDKTLAPYFVVK